MFVLNFLTKIFRNSPLQAQCDGCCKWLDLCLILGNVMCYTYAHCLEHVGFQNCITIPSCSSTWHDVRASRLQSQCRLLLVLGESKAMSLLWRLAIQQPVPRHFLSLNFSEFNWWDYSMKVPTKQIQEISPSINLWLSAAIVYVAYTDVCRQIFDI